MPRLHISQDGTGFWQLSLESDSGELTLLSHQFLSPDHLIEDARDLVAEGKVPGAVILVGAPRVAPPSAAPADADYQEPAPQRAE